jgi:hypothetical protein
VLRRTKAAERLGQPEMRTRFGHDQIAIEHNAQAKPDYIALHGGDDRLPIDRLEQQIAGIGTISLWAPRTLELLSQTQLPLVHVGTAIVCPTTPHRIATYASDSASNLRNAAINWRALHR